MVGPKVAAAAAQRALEVLAEEDPAVAAEATALDQTAQQGDQPSDDRSAAPGLHTYTHLHIRYCAFGLLLADRPGHAKGSAVYFGQVIMSS